METQTLTTHDITALRTADSYGISLNNKDGLSVIRCTKRLPAVKSGPFADESREVTHDINVSAPSSVVAWFHIYGSRGAIQAIALLARVGDVLHVSARNNNNQYCDDANLYHDECIITISRMNAAKNRPVAVVADVVVADSTCKQNSARAIRTEYSVR